MGLPSHVKSLGNGGLGAWWGSLPLARPDPFSDSHVPPVWPSSEISPLPPSVGAGGEARQRVPSFAGRDPWPPLPRGSVLGDRGGLWGLVHDTVMGVAFSFTPGPLSLGPCRGGCLVSGRPGWLVQAPSPPLGTPQPRAFTFAVPYRAGQGKLAGSSWSPLRPGQLGWWDCLLLPRHSAHTPRSPRLCWCQRQGHPASVFTGCRKAWRAVSSPTLHAPFHPFSKSSEQSSEERDITTTWVRAKENGALASAKGKAHVTSMQMHWLVMRPRLLTRRRGAYSRRCQ